MPGGGACTSFSGILPGYLNTSASIYAGGEGPVLPLVEYYPGI